MAITTNCSEYLAACRKFYSDSRNWLNLDPYRFYLSNADEWTESADGDGIAAGGLDVSWVFSLHNEPTADECRRHYADELRALAQLAVDDKWDNEQMEIFNRFEDIHDYVKLCI